MCAYSIRTINHGISYGYKQMLNSDGTLSSSATPVAVTGLVSATPSTTQNSTSFYADNVTHDTVFGATTVELAVVQYQFNHADKELEFHGMTYNGTPTDTDYSYSNQNGKYPAHVFWYVVEKTDGTEEVVCWTNVTSGAVTGVGSGTTDSDSVTAIEFDYTYTAGLNESTWGQNLSYFVTNDPTVVSAAKAGTCPTPPAPGSGSGSGSSSSSTTQSAPAPTDSTTPTS